MMNNTINGRTPEEIKRSLKCRAMWGTPDCKMKCDECGTYVPGLNGSIMAAAALAYIQLLEAAQPKWISVKERLPEEDVRVLVYFDGVIAVSEFYDTDMMDGTPMWTFAGAGGDPTHWMPLPEPPMEDNDD